MAERYAVANGNWSATATWNGGTLPGVGDDVHANGYTVTIDQDITVNSLRTTAGDTAVAGGEFADDAAGGHTITADIYGDDASIDCLKMESATSPCHLFGDVFGGNRGVFMSFGAKLTGNVFGGNSTNGAVFAQVGCVIRGTATGGLATSRRGVRLQLGSIFIGTATGGSAVNAHGVSVETGSYFIGTATGGSLNNANGANLDPGCLAFGTGIGSSTNSGAHGIHGNGGSVIIAEGVTDNTATGIKIATADTIILRNGLTIDDIDTSDANFFTEGNENLSFINEASGGVSYAALHRIAALNGLRLRTTA